MYVLENFETEVFFSIKREITKVAIELVVLDERTASEAIDSQISVSQ